MRNVKQSNFILDLTTPKWMKLFGKMRLFSTWQNEDGTYNIQLVEKDEHSC